MPKTVKALNLTDPEFLKRIVPGADPWDALLKENGVAYLCFTTFRDMGPGRRRNAAYQLFKKENSLGVSVSDSSFSQYALDHYWKERVYLYDQYLDQVQRHSRVRVLQEVQDRHQSAGRELLEAGLGEITKLVELTKEKRFGSIAPSTMKDLVVEGAKLERLALGVATDQQKIEHSGEVKVESSQEITHKVLSDPVTTALASQLLDRLALPDGAEAETARMKQIGASTIPSKKQGVEVLESESIKSDTEDTVG